MTEQEYAEYEAAVANFFHVEGLTTLTNPMDQDDTTFFSKQPCECCKRELSGMREVASGYNTTGKAILEYEVCLDCLYYATYGILDDTTMPSHKE